MNNKLSFKIPIPDVEEISRKANIRFEKDKADVSIDGRFIGFSLGAWLKHVEAAGVSFVPANKIATISRDVWLSADENYDSNPFWPQFKAICEGQPESTMIRLDPCSGLGLKGAMADGNGMSDLASRKVISPGDPRAFEIIYEFPSDTIDVWSRPWIDAQYLDGYPIEFRVFVENDEVIGLSSYYPQRELPATKEILDFVADCHKKSVAIVAHLNSQGQYPWMPNYECQFESGKVSATLDFLINQEGQAVFLEAGPPFGAGAHPCAFIDREIEGVALSLAPGVKLR